MYICIESYDNDDHNKKGLRWTKMVQ